MHIRQTITARSFARVQLLLFAVMALMPVAEVLGQQARDLDSAPFIQPLMWTKAPDQNPTPQAEQDELEDLLRALDPPSDKSDDKSKSEPEKEPDSAPKESNSKSKDEDKDRRLGEAPEDTSQLFLRQATVLLAPGEIQFDHGLTYSLLDAVTPVVLSNGSLATERYRSRQWLVPLGFRFGIKDKVQGFVDIPFGYAHVERADREEDEFAHVFGVGDVAAGMSMLLKREKDSCPDVIGTFGVSIPTGDNPFGVGANDPSLGTGFWGISANLNAVKSYDPVVLFGGVGYSHFFNQEFLGNDYQLGESFFYSFGMGMAINDDITLSTSLAGAYQFDTKVDGIRVPRTSSEPISLRLAITGTMFKCHVVEPFVRFGLTDDAAEANFGIIITRL